MRRPDSSLFFPVLACLVVILLSTFPVDHHAAKAQVNIGGGGGGSSTVASGTAVLATASIASAVCAAAITATAAGVLATDTIIAGFNADPTSTVGYQPSTSGMLTIIKYPTAGNVNFKVCNNTGSAVVPGAVTLNWRVVR